MTVEIMVEDPAWDGAGLPDIAARAAAATLDDLGLDPGQFVVGVLAAGDDRIADLNAAFRGKPTATNVLSWPAEDRAAASPGEMPHLPPPQPVGPPLELGDIALALGVIAREAEGAGVSFDAHLTHLIVHGVLHLLGFDHETDADGDLMEGIETRVLARLGIADPY